LFHKKIKASLDITINGLSILINYIKLFVLSNFEKSQTIPKISKSKFYFFEYCVNFVHIFYRNFRFEKINFNEKLIENFKNFEQNYTYIIVNKNTKLVLN